MNIHTPVMLGEVIEYLNPQPNNVFVDCTIGCGGHALKILEKITPGGILIGIDQDDEALKIAEQHLKPYKNSYKLIHNNFKNLNSILKELHIDKIGGLFFDLGVLSIHFDTPCRGFSFRYSSPLDMRMDRRTKLTAKKIVNTFSYEKLQKILRDYGQERKAYRIARLIVDQRKKKPIETTFELSALIEKASYRRGRYAQRIHPATRTFQALRIAVNDELEALKEGLESGIGHLNKGCRVVVISFHSLEDRIVKHMFAEYQQKGILNIITKSPLRPTASEIEVNPRSRSAKLRVGEKINEDN